MDEKSTNLKLSQSPDELQTKDIQNEYIFPEDETDDGINVAIGTVKVSREKSGVGIPLSNEHSPESLTIDNPTLSSILSTSTENLPASSSSKTQILDSRPQQCRLRVNGHRRGIVFSTKINLRTQNGISIKRLLEFDPEKEYTKRFKANKSDACLSPPQPNFSIRNMRTYQNFDLPSAVMHHIFMHAKAKIMVELYQSCKYTFNKYGSKIRSMLIIKEDDDDEEIFSAPSTVISVANPLLPKVGNFKLSGSLTVRASLNGRNLSLFYNCRIKKLRLENDVFWNDFSILTKSGTVEDILITRVFKNSSTLLTPVEKIFPRITKASAIRIRNACLTSNSMKYFKSCSHGVKLTLIHFTQIEEDHFFNKTDVLCFLKKCASNKCSVFFQFTTNQSLENEVESYFENELAHVI